MPIKQRVLGCFLFTLSALPQFVWSQSTNAPPTPDDPTISPKVQQLLLRVRRSNYDQTIGHTEMPFLLEAFDEANDPLTRENIASVLVTLGRKEDVYWSVLAKRGQEIVDSDAPCPLIFDAGGKSIPGKISPEFAAWAGNQGISLQKALEEQMMWFPGELSLMATTGDPRGIPILRKGLSSSNYGVRAVAAQGLAITQDKNSIPPIIQAARQAPSEARWLIAEALVAFNDPVAQAAAEELISDKNLLESARQRAKQNGPRGIW